MLPDKDVDGKGLQIQATKPTKEYLAWWALHGRRGANGAEDGEAGAEADEEAREMEAMEQVQLADFSLSVSFIVLSLRKFAPGVCSDVLRSRCPGVFAALCKAAWCGRAERMRAGS